VRRKQDSGRDKGGRGGIGKRESARAFQIRDQWLGQEKNSDVWYRYWLSGARVSRRSLGTRDFEEAKLILAKIVSTEPSSEADKEPENVFLASVFSYYMKHHGPKVRGTRQAMCAFNHTLDYLKIATGTESPTVWDISRLTRQNGFMLYCRDKLGIKTNTITSYLSMVHAALKFAATPIIVKNSRGIEDESTILKAAPKIQYSQTHVSQVTGLPMPEPRSFMPTDKEMAAFLDSITEEHTFRYVIMALNTWARPEAIAQLSVSKQVDFTRGVVNMNQPGRTQNRKRRPMIRLTENLRGWLLHWNLDFPIVYKDAPVKRMTGDAIKTVANRAGIPELSRYTLRHYMATRIKRVPGIHVDRAERAEWLGHTDQKFRTTEHWYETWDPEYLINALHATDAIMSMLDALTTRALFAPTAVKGSRLSVVTKHADETALENLPKPANNGA
jgi:integrase